MLNQSKYLLVLLVALSATQIKANPFEDRSHCDVVDNQLREVETHLSSDTRESVFENLISEIANVKLAIANRETNTPKSFLRQCLQKKQRAFEANLKNSPNSFKDRSSTNKQLAKYYQENGKLHEALEQYEKAIKAEPDNFELVLQRFYLVASGQYERIKSLPHGKLRDQIIDEHENEHKKVLTPIINNPNVSSAIKVLALNSFANFYKLRRNMEKVVEYYEKINAIDPTKPDVVATLIEYYNARDRDDRLGPLLQQYFKLKPDNLLASLEYAYFEIRRGNFVSATMITKQILNYHAGNAEALAMRGLSLFYSGRKTEGSAFIKNAELIDPKAPWLLISKAHIEYSRGKDFQERYLLSNALKHYEQAAQLLATQKNKKDAIKIKNEINTQRAVIIFEFLKSNNFPKTPAARQDAAKIVEILDPLIRGDEKSRNSRLLVEVFFKALDHSLISNKKEYCRSFAKAGVLIPQSSDASKICL